MTAVEAVTKGIEKVDMNAVKVNTDAAAADKSLASAVPSSGNTCSRIISALKNITTGAAQQVEERKQHADELAQAIVASSSVDFADIATQLKAAIEDKNQNTRHAAALAIASISSHEKTPVTWEAYAITLLPQLLELFSDKKSFLRPDAEAAAKAIIENSNQYAVKCILPALFNALGRTMKWQTKMGSMQLISNLAATRPKQIAQCLPDIIPKVSDCMWDTHKGVKDQASQTMFDACSVNGNPDIATFIKDVISCIARPAEVPECVYKLSSTTFVTTVESPALAVMEPLLVRGLAEGKTKVKRQACVIIDNMCKLVEDPHEAYLFLPKILPGIEKCIETVADPECREVSQNAHATLMQAAGDVDVNSTETKQVEVASIVNTFSEVIKATAPKVALDEYTLNYVGGLCHFLVVTRNYTASEWKVCMDAYLSKYASAEDSAKIQKAFLDKCYADNKTVSTNHITFEEEGEELCDAEFSLAYGGMILLNNARLRLTTGKRYGLCGPNGCGKSTLMRAIANGQLDGFPSPDELKTVYVEHKMQAAEAELPVVEFMHNDESLKELPRQEIVDTLASVGFTETMQANAISSLSGGWKMKLELARAMLQKADILLLDEPTNHLDVDNVKWLEDYLNSQTRITSMIVSHDSGFLDNVCTGIIHYESRKLKHYKGNLSEFVKQKPEAKSYYELSSAAVEFNFPEPGFLAEVKNKGKPILRMTNAALTYPGCDKPSIRNATVTASLASRVAVIGPNGAGKSTLIKLLTGEYEPTAGTVQKHPNMRFAYVAQHAFHHIEQHLDISANEYIQWRFQSGEDKELAAKATRQLTEEDKAQMKKVIQWEGEKRQIEKIGARRKLKKSFEYEIKWVKMPDTENEWIGRDRLERWGFEKFLQIADDREAALANLQARPLTSGVVQKHLDDFGLKADFGTHSRMRGLSGGQKVKVVLAAAMWQNPHIIVLDEPTNYLDRDSLGALATAIKKFGGGVVVISHNREFTDNVCTEVWNVRDGLLAIEGEVMEDKTKIEFKEAEDTVDAFGNKVKAKKIKKKLTRKEKKEKLRRKKEAEKNGEYYSSSDDDE